MKITKLSEEQEKQLAVYRDKWIKVGLRTGEIDKEEVETAIDLVYTCAGLNPPKYKIWLKSPLAVCIGSIIISSRIREEVEILKKRLHL